MLWSLGALLAAGLVFVGWHGVRLWLAWRNFERFEFDLEAGRAALPIVPTTISSSPPDDAEAGEPTPEEPPLPFIADPSLVDVFLLVGTDADKPSVTSLRADSILVFVWPDDGSTPLLTSLPRDLYVPDPCTGQRARISTTLEGCGTNVNGPELLAITVEDITGLQVDHFVVISFDGFESIIDELGGVEVCVANAMRVGPLELDQGCSRVDGAQALIWLRERAAQELVDGEWQAAPSGDLARTERQQQLLLQLLSRLRRFRSPLELSALASVVSDGFVLDDGLDLDEAVDVAWDLRRVNPGTIVRDSIDVEDHITPTGEFVRLPAQDFDDLLREVYTPVSS